MALPELASGEVLLHPSDALMLRNVHPDFFDASMDMVTRRAFTPNSSDDGCMSVVQANVVTPSKAYDDYVLGGLRSLGVWGVTASEVVGIGGRCVDDREKPGVTLPDGHAYIDYRDLGGPSEIRKRAKRLADLANERGRQHPPIDPVEHREA